MAIEAIECDSLSESQFNEISTLVKSVCGINLHDGKKELVKARLAKRIRQLGLSSFEQYLQQVRTDPSGNEMTSMLNSLSTNLTFFFREIAHFDYLRDTVIPRLLEEKRSEAKLRIWSAGCSSGEEPYSLAAMLSEGFAELRCWDVRILATDLSTKVLARAREGVYGEDKMRETPAAILRNCFEPTGAKSERLYRASDRLRSMITFARLNLMESWPMRGPFDVIFCRNVMIYFDKVTQGRLINRYWDILAPGGLLFVGHSESLSGIGHKFEYVRPAVYRKP